MENISGEFVITLGGRELTLKATIGGSQVLEERKLGRSIMETLAYVVEKKAVSFNEVLSIYEVGLAGNGDTRFSRDQIGEMIFNDGLINHIQPCILFLTHCLTGGKESAPDPLGKLD